MQLSTIQKYGGISLIAGSTLLTAYAILLALLLPIHEIRSNYSAVILNPNWIWIGLVAFFGVIMIIFGFLAVYTRIYMPSGLIGFTGIILLELAYILQACKVTWELCLYPVIASHHSSVVLFRDLIIMQDTGVGIFRIAASSTIFLGVTLFCLALIMSQEFPRMAGIAVFVGALFYGIGSALSIFVAIAGIIIHSIGCLLIGLCLIRNRNWVSNFYWI